MENQERDLSVFEMVVLAYTQNVAGSINLRKIVEPLFGDHVKIIEFYAMCDDFADMTKDIERINIDVLQLLKDNNVLIPPRPGTLTDAPLTMTPDGKHYLDPLAASNALSEQFNGVSNVALAVNAAISTNKNTAETQLQEFFEKANDPESLEKSTMSPDDPNSVSLIDVAKSALEENKSE